MPPFGRPARDIALALLALFALTIDAPAQTDAGRLTLDRLGRGEFQAQTYGPIRWASGTSYTVLEPSASAKEAEDLVLYDAPSGKRSVLVSASRLVPPGASAPIGIEDFAWSPAGPQVLLYTNSQKVWRKNTRGDYWLADTTTWSLHKLGGADAKPSTLMFATFSPDGRSVAYVRERNLYVESVADGRITQLTSDGSPTVVNGTFDWVYEEELNLRNGFRWSPDGQRIAYWQLNMDSVRSFDLINDTDSLYSFVVPVQYPKAGTSNSAGRIGVVAATGGATRWLDIPGDPRNQYLARMEWAASPREVVIQRLNRPQNTNQVMVADVETGRLRTVLTERDSAWLDVVDDLRWLDRGKAFLWISDRDGWRHLYRISRDGKSVRAVDPGGFRPDQPGRRLRRTLRARDGHHRGLGVLLSLARQCDPALSLSCATRWQGATGAPDSPGPSRQSRLRHSPGRPVGAAHVVELRPATPSGAGATATTRAGAAPGRQR